MNLKVILPWLCAVALGVAAVSMFLSNNSKTTEIAKLHAENQQMDELRTELDQAKAQSKTQEDEIAAFRKEQQELLRLRNEVGKLRDERQQLTKLVQTAQSKVENYESQVAQSARSSAEQLQRLQTENQQLKTTAGQAQQASLLNSCINNLRQLDGAKQQWALEAGKNPDSIPTPQDVLRYLPNNQAPVCPSGGVYTLNAVGHKPTCSVQGHVLPDQ